MLRKEKSRMISTEGSSRCWHKRASSSTLYASVMDGSRTGIPRRSEKVGLPENLGIPAGRNAGVPHVKGEFRFSSLMMMCGYAR